MALFFGAVNKQEDPPPENGQRRDLFGKHCTVYRHDVHCKSPARGGAKMYYRLRN